MFDRTIVALVVKPGSKQPGFTIENGEIVLRVRERAVDGAANAACLRAVAALFAVAPSRVELVRGHRGRRKRFAIEGLDARAVRTCCDKAFGPACGEMKEAVVMHG